MLLHQSAARAASAFSASRHLTLLLAAVLLACGAARAQGGGVESSGTGGQHSIQGRIIYSSGKRADVRMKVRLESPSFGDMSVLSDPNGSFSFRALKPGNYTVVIEGGEDYETVREPVFIEPSNIRMRRGGVVGMPIARPFTLQIYMQPKSQSAVQYRPGMVNAALAGLPKPAVELYEKALESARKGDSRKAVEQLKGALAVHPEFALALSQLGVQYLKLKELDAAAQALGSALKLMPEDYATLLTYGIVLFERRQFTEAEEQLRRALRKNSSSPSAHYYLGLALLKRNSYEEAERELQSAIASGGESIAMAYYYLGGIYWGKHEYRKAADALETYLRLAPQAENAARLRATIKELRAKG
jgi:Tfp pilus assembly protein PilF